MNTILSAYGSMLMTLTKSFMNELKSKGNKRSPCSTLESSLTILINTSFNLVHDLESTYRFKYLPAILYNGNLSSKYSLLFNQRLS